MLFGAYPLLFGMGGGPLLCCDGGGGGGALDLSYADASGCLCSPLILFHASYVFRLDSASSWAGAGLLGVYEPGLAPKLLAYLLAPADGGGTSDLGRASLRGGGGNPAPALAYGFPLAKPEAGRACEAKALPPPAKPPPRLARARPVSYLARCSGSVRTSTAD